MNVNHLEKHPIHLGRGARAHVEPEFTGDLEWYSGYLDRHREDGAEGRLVSMHTFSKPWDMWEMHPRGSEVVVCVSGSLILLQENADGSRTAITLGAGEYAINEAGTWHTADVESEATALFITAGLDTQHRPR